MAIAEITAAINGIKVAMDIGKGLLAVNSAMEGATLKIQVADLMGSLADAKVAVVNAQGIIEEKDLEIGRLTDALANKAKVVRHQIAYYEIDDAGQPTGYPYCSRCWEVDHRLVHVALGGRVGDDAICPQCKSRFDGHQVYQIQPAR